MADNTIKATAEDMITLVKDEVGNVLLTPTKMTGVATDGIVVTLVCGTWFGPCDLVDGMWLRLEMSGHKTRMFKSMSFCKGNVSISVDVPAALMTKKGYHLNGVPQKYQGATVEPVDLPLLGGPYDVRVSDVERFRNEVAETVKELKRLE